jgi:hypothetical protein
VSTSWRSVRSSSFSSSMLRMVWYWVSAVRSTLRSTVTSVLSSRFSVASAVFIVVFAAVSVVFTSPSTPPSLSSVVSARLSTRSAVSRVRRRFASAPRRSPLSSSVCALSSVERSCVTTSPIGMSETFSSAFSTFAWRMSSRETEPVGSSG